MNGWHVIAKLSVSILFARFALLRRSGPRGPREFQFSLRDSPAFAQFQPGGWRVSILFARFTSCASQLISQSHQVSILFARFLSLTAEELAVISFQFSLRDSDVQRFTHPSTSGCFNSLCEILAATLTEQHRNSWFQFSLRDSSIVYEMYKAGYMFQFSLRDSQRIAKRSKVKSGTVSILFARFLIILYSTISTYIGFNSLCEIHGNERRTKSGGFAVSILFARFLMMAAKRALNDAIPFQFSLRDSQSPVGRREAGEYRIVSILFARFRLLEDFAKGMDYKFQFSLRDSR